MADEFIKGLGIAVAAGFGWMVLSGWYNTPEFESTRQMLHPPPENLDVYGQVAMVLRDALFVFIVLSLVTFWIVIPAYREAQAAYGD